MDVGEAQADDLGGAAAGGVERLEDGAVAEVVAIDRLRGVEEAVDLIERQHLRDAVPQRRRRDQIDGALVGAFLEAEEAVEDLQRDEVAGDAGRGEFLFLAQVGDVRGQFAQGGSKVIGEAAVVGPEGEAVEVAGVGEQGVVGRPRSARA